MKTCIAIFFSAGFFAALFLAAVPAASAADEDNKDDAGPVLSTSPEEQVRIDLLVVSMPEEKYLALLPDLLDKDKIEKAVPELLEGVKRKEITLEGYPIIVTKSGQRAVTETSAEPNFIQPPDNPVSISTTPVTFWQAPPLGITLEVEAVIAPDGRHIDLNLAPCHNELLGYCHYLLPKKQTIPHWGTDGPAEPVYFRTSTTTSVTLLSGQHLLLAVHKKVKPEGAIEIFILHAEILTVGK